MKKKILITLIIAAMMVMPATYFAGSSHAEEAPVWDGSVDITWYTECADPENETDFYISTPEQLAGLAYIVNGRLETSEFPTIMKKNTAGRGAFNKTTDLKQFDPEKNKEIRTDYYVFNKYGHGAYDYNKETHSYVANTEGTGAYDKGTGVARFFKPVTVAGDYDYYADGDLFVPNPGAGTYNLEIMTEYKFDRLDEDGNHNGSYDIDVEATVANVIDETEERSGQAGDGQTASGLTAKDFFVAEPTHIISSGGFGSADDYYYIGYQKYDLMGKTIHITSDMDLGGRYYTYEDDSVKWYGPSWVPIGGDMIMDTTSTPDSQAAADLIAIESSFNGTLDGGYHTISNIYIDRWAGGNFMLCNGIGLVGRLGDLYDSKTSEYGHATEPEETPDGWMPTVRNLAIDGGYIFSNRMVGGVVGQTGNVDNGILIENCSNSATIRTTDAKGTGGICGATSGKGTVRNCYNAGNLTATYDSCPVGGIVGSSMVNIYNCYNRGQINAAKNEFSEGIGSHYEGTYTVDNCYSRQGSYAHTDNESTPGYYMGTALNVICNVYTRSASQMKTEEFLDEINGGGGHVFVADSTLHPQNGGFPVLFWQEPGFDPDAKASVRIVDSDAGKGTVQAEIPTVIMDDSVVEGRTITSDDGIITLPVGTVISLKPLAQAPNVLENYTAAEGSGSASKVRGDYYTLTVPEETVTLDGSFITLQQGTLFLNENSKCHTGISKNGVALDGNAKAWPVVDYTVTSGETVFQNDLLTVKAVIKKGAEPKDRTQEYTGTITYSFTYPQGTDPGASGTSGKNVLTNRTGLQTVSGVISSGEGADKGTLTISIKPDTQNKLWTSLADTSWCDVNNLDEEYTITTPEELAGLAKMVNDGESFKGTTIHLGQDISLKNNDGTDSVRYWIPIGNSKSFSGTFDGAGHTIKGMTATNSSMSALFGNCSGAVIKDLSVRGKASKAGIAVSVSGGAVENCINYVTVSGTQAGVGGITASLVKEGKLVGCRNKGAITGTKKIGGIVAAADSTADGIIMCANYASVTATAQDTSASTGGIAAELGCEASGCANYGTVVSQNGRVGGIAGWAFANEKATGSTHSSAITDSYNWAKVNAEATAASVCVGGLVGYAQYVQMDNCYNAGKVSLGYSGTKPHMGSLIGYFYMSAYNNVDNTFHQGAGNSVIIYDQKNSANDGRDISELSTLIDYVKVTVKTASQMKAKAFAQDLGSRGQMGFTAATDAYPQLTWITKLQDFKVTYKGNFTGTDETCYNGSVELPVCSDKGYIYTFQAGGKEWTGTGITSDVTVTVTKEAVQKAKVLLRAEGKTVGTIEFTSNETYIRQPLPDVSGLAPAKTGYTVNWDEEDLSDENGVSYWDSSRTAALGSDNIIVNAVYSQKQLDFTKNDDLNGSIKFEAEISTDNVNEDHYYFLKPRAKGTITIKEGTQVLLDGSNGPFDNIRILVEEGCDVTLKNMNLSTDPAYVAGKEQAHGVLEVTGGSNKSHATFIRACGNSRITGTNDGGNGKDNKNFFAPLIVRGYVVFDQSSDEAGAEYDTLHLTAQQKTPEINIMDGATLEIAGGILEVYKFEKLGYGGGIIYGQSFDYATKSGTGKNQLDEQQRGDLTISGGNLISISETNNVFALCVNKFTQTGGNALFYATEAGYAETGQGDNGTDTAIYASELDIRGGSLYAGVRTHQSDSADPIYYYNCAEAIRCGNSDADFSNQYFMYAVDTSLWKGSHTITVDGTEYYKGKGNIVAYDIGDQDKFTVKRSAADPYVYLWLTRGSSHTIAVDGKVIADDITPDNAFGNAYTVTTDDEAVYVWFHDQRFAATALKEKTDGKDREGTTIIVTLYDEHGNPIESLQDYSFLRTDKNSVVKLPSKTVQRAASCRVLLCDSPDTLRPVAKKADIIIK